MNMNIKAYFSSVTLLCLAMIVTLSGCKEPAPSSDGDTTETIQNEFSFNGSSHSIGSAVRFDQDNNTVQFWLSPNSGMTDIDEMAEDGDCIVLSVHKSYLGSRDRLTKSGSFIKYGSEVYTSGDEGLGYIETEIKDDVLTLKFAVEKFPVKSETALALTGVYSGSFSIFEDQPYSNEWAIERDRSSLSSASLVIREDGGSDTYILYEGKNSKAIEFTMPQSYRGIDALFNTKDEPLDGVNVLYDGGKTMELSKAYGSINASFAEQGMDVSFDLTYEGKRIRAEYKGAYDTEIRKSNRYIYKSGYPYQDHYDGRFNLSELRIERKSNGYTFKFIPQGTDEIYSDIPELRITDLSLIGKSDIRLRNTEGWHFEFDKMMLDPYENEWKPAATEESTLTIYETKDGYYVDLELSTIEPTFKYVSTIDLHFEGPVTWK